MQYPKQVYRALNWCNFLGFDIAEFDIDTVDTNYEDWTALMYATYYGNLPAVVTLVENFANLDL